MASRESHPGHSCVLPSSHRCQPLGSERAGELEAHRRRSGQKLHRLLGLAFCLQLSFLPVQAVAAGREEAFGMGHWCAGACRGTSEGGATEVSKIACVPVTSSHLRGREEAGWGRLRREAAGLDLQDRSEASSPARADCNCPKPLLPTPCHQHSGNLFMRSRPGSGSGRQSKPFSHAPWAQTVFLLLPPAS